MLLMVAWSVVPNYKFNCNAAKICVVVLFLRVLLDSFARGGFYLLSKKKRQQL